MNRLNSARRGQILGSLVEGNSLRSTSRMADVSINTVVKLALVAGAACSDYQDRVMRNLKSERVQVDEIWSFCYAKAKNVTDEMLARVEYAGNVWTFTALDADTKLIPCWLIGKRHPGSAQEFLKDLYSRLAGRVQLTSDSHGMYRVSVDETFGADVDYGQVVKVYGNDPQGETRYSPAICISCEQKSLIGNPDPEHISTSYVERSNLSMRMGMRRFTRLTNAFSKKLENHAASVALYFAYYNFVRVHKTLRCTPAMAAGVDSRLWEIRDLVELTDAFEKNSN
jgi:IS1 family transposase